MINKGGTPSDLRNSTHPRVETTHITIRNTPSIDDVLLYQLVPARLGLGLIDAVRLEPMFTRDDAEFHLGRAQHRQTTIEKNSAAKVGK